MSEYTIAYYPDMLSRPFIHREDDERKAVDFAMRHESATLRRMSDNAYYDKVTGQWIKIATSQST